MQIPTESVMRDEIMESFKYVKAVMAFADVILAIGGIGNKVLMEICLRILDGEGMPEDLAT